MISIQVFIKEAAGQRGIEGEAQPTWQPVKMDEDKYLIWRPTQEKEFSDYHSSSEERQEEGAFIYPSPYEYPEYKGIKAIQIVSRGKAEVFIRQGESKMCLIRRGPFKIAAQGIIAVPYERLGVEKRALIIFQESGKTADLFLRVNGKFTGEARIECQQTK